MVFGPRNIDRHDRVGGGYSRGRTGAVLTVVLATTALVLNPLSNAPEAAAISAVPAVVELGAAAESFSVLAATSVTSAATPRPAAGAAVGNVGAGGVITVSPSSAFNGSQHPNGDSLDRQAQAGLAAAYADARGRPSTGSLAADFRDKTLTRGVYDATGGAAFTMTASTVLTLDGGNETGSVFIIRTPAAFTMGAGVKIALINGAQASKVFWVVGAATTIGAGATVPGTIMSQAAITTGAGATLTGRVVSLHAAITLDSTSISLPIPATATASAGCVAVQPPGSAPGTTASFAVLAHDAVTTGAATPTSTSRTVPSVVGDVGAGAAVTLGAYSSVAGGVQAGTDVTLGANSSVTGTVAALGVITDGSGSTVGQKSPLSNVSSGRVRASLAAATARYAALRAKPAVSLPTGNLDGQTFSPGVHGTATTLTLSADATVTLDGGGDPTSMFVFDTSSFFTVGARGTVKLVGKAQASHVMWLTDGYATVGAGATVLGDIMSKNAINLGAGATLTGHAVALGGAVTTGANARIVGPLGESAAATPCGNTKVTGT